MTSVAAFPRDQVAVFDVDETLIRCKSMFSFLNFCLSEGYGPEAGAHLYMDFTEEVFAMAKRLPRETVNRAFYRVFKGWPRAYLDSLARDWFEREMQMGLFYAEPLAALRRHQEAGHKVVLLSGSADFILAPLAAYLQVDHLLAIKLEEGADGRLSGEIDGLQTIGSGKREALGLLLASIPVKRSRMLYGYGDHESDAPFLAMCDFKTVVLSDPAPHENAHWYRGWETMRVRPPLAPKPMRAAGTRPGRLPAAATALPPQAAGALLRQTNSIATFDE